MTRIKNIRLKKYNYSSDGYYFVTAICNNRKNLFLAREAKAEDQLKDLQIKTPGLELDRFVIMPNHVHIILILRNCKLKPGEIVRRFKAKVSRSLGENVWQPNYYEHIVRNDRALNNIREYIINNPQELLVDFEKFYL